jgi:DnaA family protein
MPMDDSQQLTLGLNLNREADFDSFFTSRDNKLIKATLRRSIDDNISDNIYISGAKGAGKSHLLQAVCHELDAQDKTAMYLPLSQLLDIEPAAILEGHQQFQFLCIDELDVIAEQQLWQEALFHLFNERMHLQLPIYFAAQLPANLFNVDLSDLKSRLASCLSFQLAKMSDEEKARLLQFRAGRMGMELSDLCAHFIVQHYSRDTVHLIGALQLLDQQSLRARRKITVPFIKQVLAL